MLAKLTGAGLALMLSSAAWAGETVTYTYDALGRLTKVAHAGTINAGLQQAYTYDPADNRTNVTVTGSPYDTLVQVIVVPLLGGTLINLGGGQ